MWRIVLLAAIGVAAGLAVYAATSDASTGPALIRIAGSETRFQMVDVGRKGRSPGDVEIVTQALYNRRITARSIGHSEMVCTYAFNRARECRGTFVLPRGKLVVGGRLLYREIYELAILGGTGLYDNARGTFTATQIKRTPRREYLVFRLAG